MVKLFIELLEDELNEIIFLVSASNLMRKSFKSCLLMICKLVMLSLLRK